jgi:hypothetical protein
MTTMTTITTAITITTVITKMIMSTTIRETIINHINGEAGIDVCRLQFYGFFLW